MTIPRWPDLLMPANPEFWRDSPSRSGPPPIAGAAQSVASDAGSWTALFGGIHCLSAAQILAFRAMRSQMDGSANPVFLSPYDQRRSPRGLAGRLLYPPLQYFSDGTPFSDGTGFDPTPFDAYLMAKPALRDTVVHVYMGSGLTIAAGQYFGLGSGDNRCLYEIATASPEGAPGYYALSIRPGIRIQNAGATGACDFFDPVCAMVCVTPQVKINQQLQLYGHADLQFREWRPRST